MSPVALLPELLEGAHRVPATLFDNLCTQSVVSVEDALDQLIDHTVVQPLEPLVVEHRLPDLVEGVVKARRGDELSLHPFHEILPDLVGRPVVIDVQVLHVSGQQPVDGAARESFGGVLLEPVTSESHPRESHRLERLLLARGLERHHIGKPGGGRPVAGHVGVHLRLHLGAGHPGRKRPAHAAVGVVLVLEHHAAIGPSDQEREARTDPGNALLGGQPREQAEHGLLVLAEAVDVPEAGKDLRQRPQGVRSHARAGLFA